MAEKKTAKKEEPRPREIQRPDPGEREQPKGSTTVALADLATVMGTGPKRIRRSLIPQPKWDMGEWTEYEVMPGKGPIAPIDASTVDPKTGEFFQPEPVKDGERFKAPDNDFWNGFVTQKVLKFASQSREKEHAKALAEAQTAPASA
jgi:hypothetical protein